MRQKKRFPARTLFAFIFMVFIAASALADVTASVQVRWQTARARWWPGPTSPC